MSNFHFGWTTPLTLMYGSRAIWPALIFELSEVSECFFSWNFVTFLHLGSWTCMQSFNTLMCFDVRNYFIYLRTVPGSIWPAYFNALSQGSPNLFLEGRCPAEFSSNLNQTHLKQLMELFLGILGTSKQVCWSKLELNSAGHRPSRTEFGDPCSKPNLQTQNNNISGYILLI